MDYALIVGIIYFVLSIICAFIQIYNSYVVSEITSRYSSARYVVLSYFFAGIAAATSAGFGLRELGYLFGGESSEYFWTVCSVLGSVISGLLWLAYSEIKQKSWFYQNKKRFIIFFIPYFIAILLILTTPLTHWYFYFEGNHYQRGILFTPISIVIFLYIAQSGFSALVRSFKKENYVEKALFRRLFVYALALYFIQVIQIDLPSELFPYRSVGTVLIYGVFLNQRSKELIGVDPQTDLNNRYSTKRYLGELFNRKDDFCITFVDVDDFKKVNDTYGHVEGDKAIKDVAEALRRSTPKSYFIARYGGDEFIVIGGSKLKDYDSFEDTVNYNLGNCLLERQSQYRFTVSLATTLKDSSITTIPDLLEMADKNLYDRKAKKKSEKQSTND